MRWEKLKVIIMTYLFWKTIRFTFRWTIIAFVLTLFGVSLIAAIMAGAGTIALFDGITHEIETAGKPKYIYEYDPYTNRTIRHRI